MSHTRQGYSGDAPERSRSDHPGNDFINSLGNAARENPMSAALIGMGVVWLFTGGANTSLFGGRGRKSIFGTAGDKTDYPGGAVGKVAGRAASSMSTAASGVSEAGRRIGEAASASVEHGAAAVSSMYTQAGEATAEAMNMVSHGVGGAARALQSSGANVTGSLKEKLGDVFERQPLTLGAMGLAIGAGIAMSLPVSEVEQRVVGPAADVVQTKVSDAVSQIKETATAPMKEADNQGLSPQAAGEAVNSISKKL